MTSVLEAPALIQYACERCKTKFVLPPSSRQLSFGGRIRAGMTALGQSFRRREGFGSTYDAARRQLLAKMDDDAYQSFVQSFKFCHECRQFVCSECWSNSRKTCLGCFARAAGTTVRQKPPFVPTGPSISRPMPALAPARRKGHLRRDASLLLMAAAVILLIVELVIVLPGTMNGPGSGPSLPVAAGSPTDLPTASPTAAPTPSPTPSATPSSSASPSATPSSSASPSASPSDSSSPTAAGPAPTRRPPTPTPFPAPKASCSPNPAGGDGIPVNCSWTNWSSGLKYKTASWHNTNTGSNGSGHTFSFTSDGNVTKVTLTVVDMVGKKWVVTVSVGP